MSNYAKSLDKLRSSALGAATVRAFATLEADESIRNPDYLAMQFLDTPPTSSDALIDFKAQLDQILPGAYHFQNARTLHIDACVSRAINDGYQQVVILGAGFDTRAYRFKNNQNIQFIEVDLPKLQIEKRKKVKQTLGEEPKNVAYVPLDFNTQVLAALLQADAFDTSKPTYFSWEGVSYYLSPKGVDATLQFVAEHTAPNSKILFDYMPASMISGAVDYYGGAQSRSYMAEFGEPVIFGIPDGQIDQFLAQRGLSVCNDLGPEALAERYLRRADGIIDGRVAGYIRMVEAVNKSA